ncbi:hypothetical protein OZX62_01530 [Bifidobacterium sp. ESL0690]|uniref:hypothetical protein n=1 Tax=Bifidobacterium sp. ESL0690 TaxID=2983214 RepID=UPI0023F9C578|nr:hypothetical protein [Bifidobacterium sp. ESL0690]WEV47006.1 hypothetical protein OZX62_01530 [Bifidobacterium sp. ESL0690]
MPDLNLFVQRMVYWCRDADLGYSQNDRQDFRDGGNADCSSLVIHCLKEAGFDTGGAYYTGNLSAELTARGWARLPVDGNPRAGDILLNDADHVAVAIGGGMLAQASISETGGIDGAGGDQTGQETNISPVYDFPWDCYLRYQGQQTTNTQGDTDMPVKTDPIDWDGENVSVEYALQDLKHKAEAIENKFGGFDTIAAAVWFGVGNGKVEDTPLYTLRAVLGVVQQIADKNGLGVDEVRQAVTQGVKTAIESIKTTVEVK